MSNIVVVPITSTAATLQVRVQDGGNNPINGARVRVRRQGVVQEAPTAGGVATFGVILNHTYDVEVEKDWFVPEPARRNGVLIDQNNKQIDVALNEVRIYLHVDADRDGQIDDDRAGIDNWTWGAGNKGAIVLCNCDNDGLRAQPHYDADDQVVNAGSDDNEIAPLQIRRHGAANAAATWTVDLEITGGDHQNVRIFNGTAQGDQEVVGPAAALYAVPNVAAIDRLNYGMEALFFADHYWNGYAEIRLTVTKPVSTGGGSVSYSSSAEVRVAPWLMASHDHDAHEVYMVNAGNGANGNQAIRNAIGNLVQGQGLPFVLHASNDRWMQDCMEIGYSTLPGNPLPYRMDCAVEAHRVGTLSAYPQTLRGPDFGYEDPAFYSPIAPTTYDSHGNLECTPPVQDQAHAHQYPWGRIYYGEGPAMTPFNAYFEDFLHRQAVQRPIPLDTDWLAVGHVDEMMTFLPNPAGAQWKEWKLLVASPTRAYQLIDQANANDPMLVGRNLTVGGQVANVAGTAGEFQVGAGDTPIPDPANLAGFLDSDWLRQYNLNFVQNGIDAILNVLVTEIDLDLVNDVVAVPILFLPEDAAYATSIALTAGMVNMLVLNGLCIVPQAYGPMHDFGDGNGPVDMFQRDLAAEVNNALGVNAPALNFVDDWDSYHDLMGEVHCGTNTWRFPPNLNNWLNSASARWWEFVP